MSSTLGVCVAGERGETGKPSLRAGLESEPNPCLTLDPWCREENPDPSETRARQETTPVPTAEGQGGSVGTLDAELGPTHNTYYVFLPLRHLATLKRLAT